jgi:hypothetical protein
VAVYVTNCIYETYDFGAICRKLNALLTDGCRISFLRLTMLSETSGFPATALQPATSFLLTLYR